MRTAVWILVVLNLLVAALGVSESYFSTTHPTHLTPEIAPERIRIMSPEEARQRRERAQNLSCAEWGPFTVAEAERAEQYAESPGLHLHVGDRRQDAGAGWWVLISPYPNRRAAEARWVQMKQLGVGDATLVQDDPRYVNAIALGTYSSEEAAQRRRDELLRLGVTDAVVMPRDVPVPRVFVRLLNVPRTLAAVLASNRADFSGTAIKECPAGG